jgi:hypothetical protein
MIFEADANQIARLDSTQLVQLMKRLLLAECQLADIPLRAATVPLQITVADGGEDGRVEWTGGADATDYFPARFCAFQSKAQNLTETTITAEVLKRPKKGPPKLNAAVSEVLSRRGSYIVFCSHPFSGQKIKRLRKAIESAVREGGDDPSRAAAIEVYDANRIADWVSTHPPVALWLLELHRRRTVVGFLSRQGWGRAPEINEVPWVANDIPRFVPVNIVIPERERKDRNWNAWTFEQAAEAVLRFLAEDKVAIRIVGPSGFGKSRFAFEVFNRRATASDEIQSTALIYTDLAVVGEEAARLTLEIADAGAPAILVVDECPDETHAKLAAMASRAGSRLRLVTIDVETKVIEAADTLVLRLEPAADEMIGVIARAVAPVLKDSDIRFIQELARGFPKMAVLAAQQKGIGRQAIRSAQQVLDRIIWGRRQRNESAQRALEFLSLFEWVGLTGRVADEAEFIAQNLAAMTLDAFLERVKSFGSRGIVIERGDFAQVTPIPLAASLAAHRLSLLPDNRLADFFAEAPDRIKGSLLRRMRWLDTSAKAKAFARRLLGAECLGNLARLNTDFGAECLDRLVHVDPDLTMATIQRVFSGLTGEELQAVNAGRRHLVWALEKLAFRKETFDGAATLLRRLAASETEGHISNNATGQFKQLYQLYLSGTETEPGPRLLVLDDGLRSLNPMEREVCVEALDKILDTNHFSRSGGAEEIGSRERLEDWAPKTYGEIWDFHRAGVKRLTDIAVSSDPLANRAKEILGSHIRGLISILPLKEIKAMVSCIVSRYGVWPEAVQGVNEWLYFDRRKAPKKLGKAVRAYFDKLMPADPVELAALYTLGWEDGFHDPDVDFEREQSSDIEFEYSTRKAIELAEVIAVDPAATNRALDKLIVSDAKSVYSFTRRLAEAAPNATNLFETALAKADQREEAVNRQFFAGLIAGADGRDPKAARDCIRFALRSGKLKKDAISMIGAGKLQSGDIQLVVSLLQSRDVEPRQCAVLSYGRGMDHLAIEDIVPLLEELALQGAEGLWTILHIISKILHGGKEPPKPLILFLRNVLTAPALFEKQVRGTMDGHHLEILVKLLVSRNLIDRQFARALVKQLLSVCSRSRAGVHHTLDGPIRAALKALMDRHPQVVWTGVARLLRGNDWLVHHKLKALIGFEHNDHLGPGLLYELPADLYMEWARKDASRRASLVVEWLPIATKAEDGSLSWHPALQDFISEFGNRDHVLAALSGRLRPRSWSGSLVPRLESQLKLLDSWREHARTEVRKWARHEINKIHAQIEDEQRSDDEHIVRYS